MNDAKYNIKITAYKKRSLAYRIFDMIREDIEEKWTKFITSPAADKLYRFMERLMYVLLAVLVIITIYDIYYQMFVEEIG